MLLKITKDELRMLHQMLNEHRYLYRSSGLYRIAEMQTVNAAQSKVYYKISAAYQVAKGNVKFEGQDNLVKEEGE